jgi:hypothetical protein
MTLKLEECGDTRICERYPMRVVAVVVIVGVALAACGSSSVSSPRAQGRVDIRIGDLINFKLGTPFPAQPGVTGTLSGSFAASIRDGSRWVDLGSPNVMTVGLQVPVFSVAPTSVHGEQDAPPGPYDWARLVLEGVSANVASGSRVSGITLNSDATVRLGGSDHYVELRYPARFTLSDDPAVRQVVVFQLNSQAWLTSSAVQSGQVEDAALQAAIGATTSIEPR